PSRKLLFGSKKWSGQRVAWAAKALLGEIALEAQHDLALNKCPNMLACPWHEYPAPKALTSPGGSDIRSTEETGKKEGRT
ncbi:unnamed protein product, partial [Cladocopium goreaui]